MLLQIVVAVGKYRTGKSFLLNKLGSDLTSLTENSAEAVGGFKVGHQTSACTRGLWMMGEPMQTTLTTGEPCTIVYMDTEGFGATDKVGFSSVAALPPPPF